MNETILTVIIASVVALIFFAIVFSSIRRVKKNKESGSFTCSGGCSGCTGGCCNYQQNTDK